MLTARVSPMPAPEPRGPAEALKAKEAGALLALGEPAGGLFSHSRPRACSRRSSGALSHSSLFSEAVLVCNLASALRAVESSAYQVWHLLCLVVAVFGVDASVLLRLPDQGRAAEGLDGALVVVLATFSGDWLVRASQRVSAGEQSPGFWRTAACYTDALSTATVVADLSWLRAGSSPALLRAARAARLVRFSRLARHTHAALFWLARGGKALDDAALDAAPSAIAAALCEEVAHKARAQSTAAACPQVPLSLAAPPACSAAGCGPHHRLHLRHAVADVRGEQQRCAGLALKLCCCVWAAAAPGCAHPAGSGRLLRSLLLGRRQSAAEHLRAGCGVELARPNRRGQPASPHRRPPEHHRCAPRDSHVTQPCSSGQPSSLRLPPALPV